MNIFLTGDINIGKSTVIDKVIKKTKYNKKDIKGFKTRALLEKEKVIGFYIDPINYKKVDMSKRIIGKEVNDRWIGITKNFEEYGFNLVKDIINSKEKLVVLDELGFFENKAVKFQDSIHKLLSSNKLILGVIKPVQIPFMDSIRERKDVEVFAVSKYNRGDLPEKIYKRIK
ncbi:MAG: hypothetical protein FH751_09075 [Firmicutes bacterium]|nr:hypothetical protein [Bacillota bacterium]